MGCCLIAALFALFSVEFANPVQAVLQLCQYSFNIPGQYQAQQKLAVYWYGFYVRRNIAV
jgi:hypothetical protein